MRFGFFGRVLILTEYMPNGSVLGEVSNTGLVINPRNQQPLGRVVSNNLVRDTAGNQVIAEMVRGGFVVGFGCKQIGYLEADGRIRKDNKTTDYRVLPDGVVVSPEGAYVGEVAKTGKVFDNNCMLLGEADPDGIVRDANKQYVGCVNPDGTVLDEKGNLIGGVLMQGSAVGYDGKYLGKVNADGLVINDAGTPVGCVGTYGDVFNKDGGYVGHVSGRQYAFDLSGNFLNVVDAKAEINVRGQQPLKMSANGLVLNDKNEITGIVTDSRASLFPISPQRSFPNGADL